MEYKFLMGLMRLIFRGRFFLRWFGSFHFCYFFFFARETFETWKRDFGFETDPLEISILNGYDFFILLICF